MNLTLYIRARNYMKFHFFNWSLIVALTARSYRDCHLLGNMSNCRMQISLTSIGPGSSSGKALDYGLDGPGSTPGIGGVEIFLHFFLSRLVLGSTQPPTQLVPGAFPGGIRGRA